MYEPFNSANQILSYKNQWDSGDENAKKKAAKKAETYYNDLRNNNYGELADRLQGSNTQQAKEIVDGLSAKGKSSMRKTITDTLTGVYGLSEKDANDRISWDQNTGDVYLGSRNLGSGDAFVNGTHYTADPDKLVSDVKDYASSVGLYPSAAQQYNQFTNEAAGMNRQLWDLQLDGYNTADGYMQDYMDFVNTPYQNTKEYQRFMDKYAEMGEKAGWNTIAGSAGSNGGNMDSYAQAQAQRQYNSLLNQGDEAARAWYTARANQLLGGYNAYGTDSSRRYNDMLKTIGITDDRAQQIFDNEQTALNNESKRLADRAEVTGNVPIEWLYADNIYLNSDGSLRPEYENTDFYALINQARAQGANNDDVNQLLQARWAKVLGDADLYAQYGDTLEVPSQTKRSEKARQFDQTDATNRYAIDSELEGTKYVSDNNLEGEIHASDNATKIAFGGYDSNERINYANNKNALDLAGAQTKVVKGNDIGNGFYISNSDDEIRASAAAKKNGVNDNGAKLLQRLYNEYLINGLREVDIDQAIRYNSDGLDLTQAEIDNVKVYLYSLL